MPSLSRTAARALTGGRSINACVAPQASSISWPILSRAGWACCKISSAQAISCGNRPPRVAYPELPTLPALPEQVDPDTWLAHIHGQAFTRRVQPNGSVEVDRRPYYVKQVLAGQQVVLVVNAPEQTFEVLLGKEHLKSLPIKGLVGQVLPFDEYAARMRGEARSEYRRWVQQHRGWRQASLWAS